MKTLELMCVSKIYQNGVKAMDKVSLTVSEGEFIAVMGQSGSGKSTLLQVMGLLDKCSEGAVIINGKDVSGLSDKELAEVRKKTLGFVFQSFHLNPYMKLYENIMLPLLVNDKYKTNAQMKERAMKLVETMGLAHRVEHYPGELSGGEQQRVAIARAMANEPDFILADEPTGNLDSKNEQMIFNELKKLSQSGKGVLVVCHNEAILDYADKVYIMKDGVLKEKDYEK